MKPDISSLVTSGERPTKKQMLKCLMSLFDPLGFLSLFVVHGKILLQEVWRTGAQWDEKVNDDLYLRWKNWTQLFEAVSRLKIPRCYFSGATKERYQNLQLHLFVDASESAYCAVAYFRTINDEGIPECALVAAKNKGGPTEDSIDSALRIAGRCTWRTIIEVYRGESYPADHQEGVLERFSNGSFMVTS